MDSILDGFVEDILGLLSCQVHPRIKSRIGMYKRLCGFTENFSLLTACSFAELMFMVDHNELAT